MSLTQYYTATTLDGFIADPDHSLEWLFTRDQDHAGVLNYAAFIAGVGALAMGRTTYEWILDHEFADKDPSEWKWPYDIPCWVFTNHDLTVVPGAQITFVSGDVAPVHAEMVVAAEGRNVWIVGGGELVGQFADAATARRGHRVHRAGDARRGCASPLAPRGTAARGDGAER